MKEKSVRRQTEALVADYFDIPEEILRMNAGFEVSLNVIFVNKLAFLESVSKSLKFTMIEYIPNRLEKELSRFVNKIIGVY